MTKRYRRWSRRIERNLLTVYYRANEYDREEGMYWYANAHYTAQFMADKHNVTLWQACGVIAAISPGLNWGINLIQADLFISEWQAGVRGYYLPTVGTYGYRNVHKAVRILKGESPDAVLGGPKVRAFFYCLLEPKSNEVCVDRHAKCAAYNIVENRDANALVREGREYEYLAWHYKVLAERLGLVPNQFQAIVWTCWRRLKGLLEQADLPF